MLTLALLTVSTAQGEVLSKKKSKKKQKKRYGLSLTEKRRVAD